MHFNPLQPEFSLIMGKRNGNLKRNQKTVALVKNEILKSKLAIIPTG